MHYTLYTRCGKFVAWICTIWKVSVRRWPLIYGNNIDDEQIDDPSVVEQDCLLR